jgi:regulator of nucleoside diphosphate kinase
MSKEKAQLIVAKDDHAIIMSYLRNGLNRSTFNRQEADSLEAEMKKAKLVEKIKLPEDVVCLNSTVIIKEEKADKVMELTLVTPEKADIKQKKISILSPIAAALIGFRKGMKVAWKVPAGLKTFMILDVRRPLHEATSI